MVGGWHSLLSIVYRGTRDYIDLAIDEGHAAAATVRAARQQLQSAFAAWPGTCEQACTDAVRSLDYQQTLFDALAAWRQAFLSYYRWLDTGDDRAWATWRDGRTRFAIAAVEHVARFGNDVTFPAFDLTSATRAVDAADRGGFARFLSAVLVIGVVALLVIGRAVGPPGRPVPANLGALGRINRLLWRVTWAPWHVQDETMDSHASVTVTLIALTLAGVLVSTLTASRARGWAAARSWYLRWSPSRSRAPLPLPVIGATAADCSPPASGPRFRE